MDFYKIRKFLSTLTLLLVITVTILGQEKENIAVLPFLATDVPVYLPLVVGRIIEKSLIDTNAFNVISQGELKTKLGKDYNSYLECDNPACAIKIGKILSAKQIIVGTVSALEDQYTIDSVIIDVTTAKILYSETSKVKSVKDLSDACETLALSLSRNANPGLVIEIPDSARRDHVDVSLMENQAKVDNKTSTNEKDAVIDMNEKPGSSNVEEDQKTDSSTNEPSVNIDKSNEGKKSASLNIPAYLLFTTGILSQTAGNVVQNIAFQYQLSSNDTYSAYMAAGIESADIYTNYLELNGKYTNYTYLNYGLWAGGGLIPVVSSIFLGNSSLSVAGNFMYASSILLNTAGNLANAVSVVQLLKMRSSHAAYMTDDGSGTEDLYNQYLTDYNLLNLEKLVGYGLWGGGSLFALSSYLMPGRRTFSKPSFLESLLSGLGYIMFSAGNYSFSMGTNMLLAADQSYTSYMGADEFSAPAVYSEYESYLKKYTLLSYTSYGLWGGGALLLISSLFVPDRVESVTVSKAQYDISIRPALLGLGVNVGIQWK